MAPHTIDNSVLWANSGTQVSYITSVQDPYIPLSVTWSDVMTAGASTPYAGSGNINADPLFAVYGTWSAGVWTDGDYHLSAGSPAIDAGSHMEFLLILCQGCKEQRVGIGYRENSRCAARSVF